MHTLVYIIMADLKKLGHILTVFLLPPHPVSFDSQFLTETHTLNQCASMGLMQFSFAIDNNAFESHYYELGPIDFSGAHPREPGVLGRKMNTEPQSLFDVFLLVLMLSYTSVIHQLEQNKTNHTFYNIFIIISF